LSSATLDTTRTVKRLAFGSCFKVQRGEAGIWDAIAATDSGLFIYAGDTLYPDSEEESMVIGSLQQAYTELAAVESLTRLRMQTPVLPVWDDHDYGKNDGGADFVHRKASEDLFEQVWGLAQDDPRRRREGIYHSVLLGEPGMQLQVILLDTRYFRSPLQETDEKGARGKERYVPDPDPRKTLLGEAQWAWLEGELAKPADLRLLVSSIQVLADGHGWEGWRQLPAERERLFELLREDTEGALLLLSGDRHIAGFYENDIGLSRPLLEFTSSALNNTIALPYRNIALAEAGPFQLGGVYGDANFGTIDIDWEAGRVVLGLRDKAGQIVKYLERQFRD
jgi:alkaline phosphatase D